MSEHSAKIISFPSETGVKRGRKTRGRIRNVDGIKYFNEKQIKLLRRTVREQAELDEEKGLITGIREWMVIDLLTSTGLRVSEAANLRCGDLKIGYSIIVPRSISRVNVTGLRKNAKQASSLPHQRPLM